MSRGALEEFLVAEIAAHGPMSLADFMGHALGHPEHGYYMTRDPFGRGGDFTTAPEISQIFGEMVGVWAVEAWSRLGSPEAFVLLECGPGRGTLMADLLRAATGAEGFVDAAQVCLMEISPVLKARQAEALQGFDPIWVEGLSELSADVPVIAIGNEFLDALPVHQLEWLDGAWFERCVDYKDGAFVMSERLAAEELVSMVQVKSGLAEVSPQRLGFMRELAGIIEARGGAGVFIDYGHGLAAAGDTLQAVYKHKPCGVIEHIGDADVTAHVDFDALMGALDGMDSKSLMTQRQFLMNYGSDLRAQVLAAKSADIQSGYDRLVARDQMGELFKVLSFNKGGS